MNQNSGRNVKITYVMLIKTTQRKVKQMQVYMDQKFKNFFLFYKSANKV